MKYSGDVAIVGMACIFPDALDVGSYWKNILWKVSSVKEPPDYLGIEKFFDPESKEFERIYCKRGGYLGELARFEPLKFGVVPSSIEGSDPDHLLALQIVHNALVDSGIEDKNFPRDRTEVILGHATYINHGNTNWLQHSLILDQTIEILKSLNPNYTQNELEQLRSQFKKKLPAIDSQVIPSLIPNIMAGRIANRFDFMGPSYIIDAACASSIIAIDLGKQDLLSGKCDISVVGGIQGYLPPAMLMLFCELKALSFRSEIRPFDKNADGTILGEGGGIIILKRREDAEKDKDRIYAIIKGIGVASDGKAKGLLAPRLEGEVLAMERAYSLTGISPDTVELIEAHGTGIPLGDVMEMKALSQIFGEKKGNYPTIAVGSVKSMLGHLLPASGIAGIIKTALALYNKLLPPTINCEEPNPELEIDKTPFYINTEVRPWIHIIDKKPRRAGVNSFGFGGINAHCILEEHS